MSIFLKALAIRVACAATCQADSTVRLNNIDAQMPIYLYWSGHFASGDEVVYAAIYAGAAGSQSHSLYRTGTAGNDVSDYVFAVDRNGYFDAGVGIVPGLIEAGGNVELTLVAWLGDHSGPTAIPTAISGSTTWSQTTGVWNPMSGTEPTGPILRIPESVVVQSIPESSTLTLGLMGGVVLLTTHFAKTSKRKAGNPVPIS